MGRQPPQIPGDGGGLPPPPGGAAVEAFLREAAFIISEQRGLGPLSLMLIEAAAQRLGLPPDQWHQALDRLTGAASNTPPANAPPANGPLPLAAIPRSAPIPGAPPIPRAVPVPRAAPLAAPAGTPPVASIPQAAPLATPPETPRRKPDSPAVPQEATPKQAARPDPQVEEFLKRAAACIAEMRGINPQSLARIDVIAEEIGLSPEKTRRALAALRPKKSSAESEFQRQRKDFENYVGEYLVGLSSVLLIAGVKRQLIAAGTEQFSLPRAAAEATVEEIADALGIAFVSHAQVVGYVDEMVREALGSAARLSDEERATFLRDGAHCGLEAAEVEGLIRARATQRSAEADHLGHRARGGARRGGDRIDRRASGPRLAGVRHFDGGRDVGQSRCHAHRHAALPDRRAGLVGRDRGHGGAPSPGPRCRAG